MNDEEEFEYEEEVYMTGPVQRRFVKTDILVLGLGLAQGIAGAVHDTLSMAQALVAAHVNFEVSQREFHEEVSREIETMTHTQTGECDG